MTHGQHRFLVMLVNDQLEMHFKKNENLFIKSVNGNLET